MRMACLSRMGMRSQAGWAWAAAATCDGSIMNELELLVCFFFQVERDRYLRILR